jgi:F0F1-type ATP synthase membrane subunit b/b'
LKKKNTIKDHYSKRAERVFERLMEKYKSKQESEVSKDD